jgi:hypothetical protein
MSDKISGKFHPIPSTIANQRWISIRNIIIYLETKFRPNRRIFLFGGHFVPWLPWQRSSFWFVQPPKSCHILGWIFLQSGSYYGFQTIDINSQHQNLLGNQISPKSEDFCIWHHFIPWLPWQRPPFWILTILHHLGCFNCNQQLIETLLAW